MIDYNKIEELLIETLEKEALKSLRRWLEESKQKEIDSEIQKAINEFCKTSGKETPSKKRF